MSSGSTKSRPAIAAKAWDAGAADPLGLGRVDFADGAVGDVLPHRDRLGPGAVVEVEHQLLARRLEAVSQAAITNLEHLRKHLPVVTSAAKDVTNQIGSAGNNAQVQIKSLIASLERVSDAGKSVNAYIDNVETRADDLSFRLEQSLSGSAKLLDDKSAEALDRSAQMATLMDRAAQAISSGIAQASGDIDTILAGSQAKIQTSLSDLRGALSEIEAQSQQEDARAMRKTLDRLNDKIGGAK